MNAFNEQLTSSLLSQMKKGSLEYCVMALMQHKDQYGFELVQTLSNYEGMITSEGTVYPILTRLRKDGKIDSYWQESESGPPRRYYKLTDQGRAALLIFKEEWSKFRNAVDNVLGNTA